MYMAILTHLPQCRIFVLVNWVSIGSANGLSPDQCQAINWTNADFLSIGSLGTHFSKILMKNKQLYINENACENVVCWITTILSRGEVLKP